MIPQPNAVPQLPQTFFAQALARVKEKSPKFYQLIMRYSWVPAGVSAVLWFVITSFLPGIGVEVPDWLNYAHGQFALLTTFLAGLGLGGLGVASTTIQTPATPPLITSEDKPNVAEQLAQIQAELQELRNQKTTAQRPDTLV